MKKTLLATVAAAALFAGTSFAMAEGMGRDQGGGAGGGAQQSQRGGGEMNKSGAESKGSEQKGAQQKGAQSEQKGGKSQTTGQGAQSEQKGAQQKGAQSEQKGAQQKGAQSEQKGAQQKGAQSEQKGKGATTGQGTGMDQQKSGQAQQKSGQTEQQKTQQAPSGRNQAQQPSGRGQAQQGQQGGATTGQGAATSTQAGGAVNLTSEQKTQIRTTVLQGSNVPRVERSSVNFNISVGTVVPRSGSVRIVEVPDTIVRIHPQWRGYRYFVVDEEIIIVEPSSYKIVAVLNV